MKTPPPAPLERPTRRTGRGGGPELVLASASPRRQALLRELGVAFTARPGEVDETPVPGELPEAYVLRLAREKARSTAGAGELALAADTAVVLDGHLLGKPRDEGDSRRMLRRLAGREHTVLTGVALHEGASGQEAADVDSSRVRIAPLSEEEIRWYAETGEPSDKAGSYAVQGLGALFVEGISGNYTNVVGLPLPTVYRLFRRLGFDLRDFLAS